MHDYPTRDELADGLLALCYTVLLLLCVAMWIESLYEKRKARKKAKAARKPLSPEEQAENAAELDRWLYEGRG